MTRQFNAPLIATSLAVTNLPGLADLLGVPVVHRLKARDPVSYGGVIAWGRKPSSTAASEYAARHNLSLLRLEDGFLRSVSLGNQDPPFSIVVDEAGIYYDATIPSRLESLTGSVHDESQRTRARDLITAWQSARVSKYNHSREYIGDLPSRYVLVADQTLGDASIQYGLADKASFQRMLSAALDENPDCTVLLKVHPEVMSGRKRGFFDLVTLAKHPRIRVLGTDVHPVKLIEHAEIIYTVTSQIGFEGLLWNKPVRTFGMPFYAGWGLTQDEMQAPSRRKPVSQEDLVYAALVEYPRYIDPETGQQCEVERLINWMALQRQMRERFPEEVIASGFSWYKRPIVRTFLQGSSVRFVRRAHPVPHGVTRMVWGMKENSSPIDGAPVVRLEDGFIRSVGLGADLVRPLSWIADRQGIYFNATRPSDLESILQENTFDAALLARAKRLRERLVAYGLTKYNVDGPDWHRPIDHLPAHSKINAVPTTGRMILVPGQVETDASISYGAPGVSHNLDLLRLVRESNPDAYVIYKPHPDVVAGLRSKGLGETDSANFCDEIVTDVSMGELLGQVDEVHTMTSLTGFEALLRGKIVVCYGQPFYAGWGLTQDKLPISRRTRRLSLDELVTGALILYPTYISRITGKFTTPERALDELLAWRSENRSTMPRWGSLYRFLVKYILRKP